MAVLALTDQPYVGYAGVADTDGDGYDDDLEAYLGTDPLSDCPLTSSTDAWPPDLDSDGDVDTGDLVSLGPIGLRSGDVGFVAREDLNGDGIMGALDLAQLSVPIFFTSCPPPYVPPPATDSIDEIAIDMDVTGNDARLTSGADVQVCGEIDSAGSNTVEMDIVMPAPGVHASDGIEVWEFLLNYDPAVVNVVGEDQDFLLAEVGSPGNHSDSLPDAGGSWRSAALEPVDPESGPGVLTRITLSGVSSGTSVLTLTKVGAGAEANGAIPIDTVFEAVVLVDGDCPPADFDGDGYLDMDEMAKRSDPLEAASTPEHCDAVDNDGDTVTDEPPALSGRATPDSLCDDAADPDGDTVTNDTDTDDDDDGFSDAAERYMSTDELDDCPVPPSPPPDPPRHDAWPPDPDGNGSANVGDLIQLFGGGKILQDAGDPFYSRRSDADASGEVNVGDLIQFFGGGVMLTSC